MLRTYKMLVLSKKNSLQIRLYKGEPSQIEWIFKSIFSALEQQTHKFFNMVVRVVFIVTHSKNFAPKAMMEFSENQNFTFFVSSANIRDI